jgi:hypothetical protein
MVLIDWILPLLIGIVAAVLLLSILYNNSPQLRQHFADLGALIQLETSKPVYYGARWIPVDSNVQIPNTQPTGNITNMDSPFFPQGSVVPPIYNYYPQTGLNLITDNNNNNNNINSNIDSKLAYKSRNVAYPYDSYYYGFSGGVAPYPVMIYPTTNIDAVRGVEDKI